MTYTTSSHDLSIPISIQKKLISFTANFYLFRFWDTSLPIILKSPWIISFLFPLVQPHKGMTSIGHAYQEGHAVATWSLIRTYSLAGSQLTGDKETVEHSIV